MLWIVPSRSRPGNVVDLISSFQVMRCYADILIVFDADDPDLKAYEQIAKDHISKKWCRFAVSDRIRLGATLNKWAIRNADRYKFIGFMGDDHRPRTPIWDGLMAAKLRKMKTGLVYGNDLFQGEKLPTAVCMTSDIIKTLGYMVPPNMIHLYLDNFWKDLGEAIGRISYMENVVIEHLHPHAGKAESDAQYEALNSRKQHESDSNALKTYKRKQFNSDVEKLKGIL